MNSSGLLGGFKEILFLLILNSSTLKRFTPDALVVFVDTY